jgi:exodeoxyribonuclease VII small subunit
MPAKFNFEKSLERLEEIVEQLEGGEVKLEDAIKIFEEGVDLFKQCAARLNEAEKKIKKLVKTEEGFQLELLDEEEEPAE